MPDDTFIGPPPPDNEGTSNWNWSQFFNTAIGSLDNIIPNTSGNTGVVPPEYTGGTPAPGQKNPTNTFVNVGISIFVVLIIIVVFIAFIKKMK